MLNAETILHSMTGDGLRSWRIICKSKVPNERTECHRKHDHTIVSHEEKPKPCQHIINSGL